MTLAKRGGKFSEETKQKMRDTHAKLKDFHCARAKAQWSDPCARKAKSVQMTGMHVGDETRSKLSDVSKTRWANAEYKARLSVVQKIAQGALAQNAADRMKAKWADPAFRETMLLARSKARESVVVTM